MAGNGVHVGVVRLGVSFDDAVAFLGSRCVICFLESGERFAQTVSYGHRRSPRVIVRQKEMWFDCRDSMLPTGCRHCTLSRLMLWTEVGAA